MDWFGFIGAAFNPASRARAGLEFVLPGLQTGGGLGLKCLGHVIEDLLGTSVVFGGSLCVVISGTFPHSVDVLIEWPSQRCSGVRDGTPR